MKVSALVLTRNRPIELLKCIESIRQQSLKAHEIIILDNGSEKENSLEEYSNELKDCILIKSDKNLGCPGGRNHLIEKSSGDFLLFVDDDGYLSEDSVKNSINYFKTDEKLGVVTFRIINPDTGKIRDGIKKDIAPFFHYTFGGGSCIIKREVLNLNDLYPIDYLRQGEEFDLALRIFDLGYKILYAPDAILYHEESKSSPEVFLNSQLSTITTSWRYLPYHYSVLRTLINSIRIYKEYQHFRLAEITTAVKNGLSRRDSIKYSTYLNWLIILQNVKNKINVEK